MRYAHTQTHNLERIVYITNIFFSDNLLICANTLAVFIYNVAKWSLSPSLAVGICEQTSSMHIFSTLFNLEGDSEAHSLCVSDACFSAQCASEGSHAHGVNCFTNQAHHTTYSVYLYLCTSAFLFSLSL